MSTESFDDFVGASPPSEEVAAGQPLTGETVSAADFIGKPPKSKPLPGFTGRVTEVGKDFATSLVTEPVETLDGFLRELTQGTIQFATIPANVLVASANAARTRGGGYFDRWRKLYDYYQGMTNDYAARSTTALWGDETPTMAKGGAVLRLPGEAIQAAGDSAYENVAAAEQALTGQQEVVAPAVGAAAQTAVTAAMLLGPRAIGKRLAGKPKPGKGPYAPPDLGPVLPPQNRLPPGARVPEGAPEQIGTPAKRIEGQPTPQLPYDGTIFVDSNGRQVLDPAAPRKPTKDVTPVPSTETQNPAGGPVYVSPRGRAALDPTKLPRAHSVTRNAPEISNGKRHSVWENSAAILEENVPPGWIGQLDAGMVLRQAAVRGDPRVRSVFEKLAPLLDKVPVVFQPKPEVGGSGVVNGFYDPDSHVISVRSTLKPGIMMGTLVHEAVHAATSRYMQLAPTSPFSQSVTLLLTEALQRAQKMTRIRGVDYTSQYGLTHPEEFVSEALSNTTFQRFLAVSEGFKSKGAEEARSRRFLGEPTTAMARQIAELFGLKNPKYPSKLLNDVIAQVGILIEEQDFRKGELQKAIDDHRSQYEGLTWTPESRPDLVKAPERMQKGPGPQPLQLPDHGKALTEEEIDVLGDPEAIVAKQLGVPPKNLDVAFLRTPADYQGYYDKGWTIYRMEEMDGSLTKINPHEEGFDAESAVAVQAHRGNNTELSKKRVAKALKSAQKGSWGKTDPERFRNVEKHLTPEQLKELERLRGITAAEALADALRESQKHVSAKALARDAWGMESDPVVYMHAGIPVTKASIEAAFRLGKNALGKIPGWKEATDRIETYWTQILMTVSPEGLGPEAKTAAATVAKGLANEARKTSQYVHRSADRRAFWEQRAAEVADFLNKFERGQTFADPTLNKVAEGYREWAKEIYEQDMRTGFDYEPIDNYLAHIFENSEGVAEFFTRKYGSKWNNPGFIKDRGFDLYSQAIAAGFKPKFTNPEDIMLARQHASDVAQMRVEIFQELEGYGLAVKVKKGDTQGPDNFPSTQWRSPTGQRYWVHNNASAILHNAFNTRSLWNLEGMGGDAFRGMMWLKNSLVPIQLGFSLFHPLHVATIANAAGIVRASKELFAGTISPQGWMKEMVESLFYKELLTETGGQLATLFGKAPRSGHRLLHAYQGKIADAELTAADRVALSVMAEGGFIPEMSTQYKTTAIQNFKDALARRSLKAGWWAVWALPQALQYPMFQVWIPSMKITSYLKDVQAAVRANPDLLADMDLRQQTFRAIAKNVDNRYGEMAYNTLFWNRMAKDIGVGSMLSLGWQLGFLREYGGALMDVGQFAGTGTSKIKQIASGRMDRPMFVTAYTLQALAYGGLLTYLMSGDMPETLMDYLFPKIGEKNADGSEKRVGTMFYPNEFYKIHKHMEHEGAVAGLAQTIANKASPAIGFAKEWATGVDALGREVIDPDSPLVTRLGQKLTHAFSALTPLSLQNLGASPKENVLSVAGFTPAPKYVTETTTQGAIKSTYLKYYGGKRTAYEKATVSDASRRLRNVFEAGDIVKYSKLLDQIRSQYELTDAEVARLERRIQGNAEDPYVSMFKRLDEKQQTRLLEKMTPEEVALYLPAAKKSIQANFVEKGA
ncbi:MAG: hypothetical protein SFV24_19070 [Gemmatimonadales bacterium]|nr:hypothetical protein [Gemmatimonadales bacterium]